MKAWVIVRQSAREDDGQHIPPETWLGNLLGCACGHGIGRHSTHGCLGDVRGPCECTTNPNAILGVAIWNARRECELELRRKPHAER
jgi:hypothetical protein